MDQQKRSKDRNAKQPENGQMMTELKFLKAQIVAKDKRIAELEGKLKAVEKEKLTVVGEIVAKLDDPAIAKRCFVVH